MMSILLDASIKGSVLLALAWVVTRILRDASAAARHLVWCAALAGMVLIPLASTVVPRIPVSVPSIIGASSVDAVVRPMPAAVASERARLAPVAIGSPRARTIGIDRAPDSPSLARSVPAIWLAIAALVLLRVILGTLRVSRWSRRAYPVSDGAWLSLAQRVVGQLDIGRPVTLLQSDRACVPMTWGVVYPTVLLPSDADEWTTERRTIVLFHELAHVKRFDALTQLLAQIVVAVFWFNPLVWLAARQMRIEREHACDDFVLEAGARATDYAYDLLQIARSLGRAAAPAAALAMARRSELEGRLLSILDPQTNHRGVSRVRLALATLCVLGLAIPLAAFAPATQPTPALARAPRPEPAAAAPVARRVDNPLRAWPRASTPRPFMVDRAAPTARATARSAPDRETLLAVAKAATKMSSDHEKAELLLTIAKYYAEDDELCTAYLDVVTSLTSDYERVRTLLPLLAVEDLPVNAIAGVTRIVPLMTSDYSRGQAINAAAIRSRLTNKEIIELIDATTTITGSYEKANALVAIASHQSIDDAVVRKAFLAAAETTTSASDYRRVVSTILK